MTADFIVPLPFIHIDREKCLRAESHIQSNSYNQEDVEAFLDYLHFITIQTVKKSYEASKSIDLTAYLIGDLHPSNAQAYAGLCGPVTASASFLLNELNVVNYKKGISPICNKKLGHAFGIAEFDLNGNIQPYLIDNTFIQFFNHNAQRNHTITEIGGEIGSFGHIANNFIKDENGSQCAQQLITRGWIPLNDETSRIYTSPFQQTANEFGEKNLPDLNSVLDYMRQNEDSPSMSQKNLKNVSKRYMENVANFQRPSVFFRLEI